VLNSTPVPPEAKNERKKRHETSGLKATLKNTYLKTLHSGECGLTSFRRQISES
jgi:hypothetical protein